MGDAKEENRILFKILYFIFFILPKSSTDSSDVKDRSLAVLAKAQGKLQNSDIRIHEIIIVERVGHSINRKVLESVEGSYS